jgi:hypothetical protein
MALPEIDLSHWPILIIRLPESMTIAEIHAHYDELGELARSKLYFGQIVDGTRASQSGFTAAHRKALNEGLERIVPILEGRRVCEAVVLPNMLLRGVLTALEWAYPSSWPRKPFETFDEAFSWCDATLRRRNLPPSEPPAFFRAVSAGDTVSQRSGSPT